MLKEVEDGRTLSDEDFEELEESLRARLIRAQIELTTRRFAVILEVNSFDRRAANRVLNALLKWLDPRHVVAEAVGDGSAEEEERPFFYRYWGRTPRHGQIGLFLNGWSSDTIRSRLDGISADDAGPSEPEFLERIRHIEHFERMHAESGTKLMKVWLHTPEELLRDRVQRYESADDNAWTVADADVAVLRQLKRGNALAETLIGRTEGAHAPWLLIESSDQNLYTHAVGEALAVLLESALANEGESKSPSKDTSPETHAASGGDVLRSVDLSQKLSRETYHEELAFEQQRLHRLAREASRAGVSALLAFEGWDAAGKGGAIRRLTAALDAVNYRTVRIAAPTPEEAAHHYLWRFWTQLPRAGKITIFDRSWYGRVLVERVEGFASQIEWRRAYAEINDFEEQWTETGNVLLKFWLHLDEDEQLDRFKERERTPYKQHKITPDDYRNRERWSDYERAVHELVVRTSTPDAPWVLVPAQNKRFARVFVVRAVADALEDAIAARSRA